MFTYKQMQNIHYSTEFIKEITSAKWRQINIHYMKDKKLELNIQNLKWI